MINLRSGATLLVPNLFILLFMAILVSGCTVPLTCKLYNNTGTAIRVVQRDKLDQEKRFSLMPQESVSLRDWGYFVYHVENEHIDWNYDPPIASYIPSSEYIEVTGFGPFLKRTIRAQLNADGKIFLIKIGQDTPSSIIVEQPEGYPLVPNATTKTNI